MYFCKPLGDGFATMETANSLYFVYLMLASLLTYICKEINCFISLQTNYKGYGDNRNYQQNKCQTNSDSNLTVFPNIFGHYKEKPYYFVVMTQHH